MERESSRESDLPAVIVLASDDQNWRIGKLGNEEMTEGSVGLNQLGWEDLQPHSEETDEEGGKKER